MQHLSGIRPDHTETDSESRVESSVETVMRSTH